MTWSTSGSVTSGTGTTPVTCSFITLAASAPASGPAWVFHSENPPPAAWCGSGATATSRLRHQPGSTLASILSISATSGPGALARAAVGAAPLASAPPPPLPPPAPPPAPPPSVLPAPLPPASVGPRLLPGTVGGGACRSAYALASSAPSSSPIAARPWARISWVSRAAGDMPSARASRASASSCWPLLSETSAAASRASWDSGCSASTSTARADSPAATSTRAWS
jgi:hypothetical protein